jgi:hypothetical protein
VVSLAALSATLIRARSSLRRIAAALLALIGAFSVLDRIVAAFWLVTESASWSSVRAMAWRTLLQQIEHDSAAQD